MQTQKVFEHVSAMLPCPGPGHIQCPYMALTLQGAQKWGVRMLAALCHLQAYSEPREAVRSYPISISKDSN